MYPAAITLLTHETTSPAAEPPGLVRLKREYESKSRRLEEQLLTLDATSWRVDRFYDGTFGYLGGAGYAGGYLPDRAQDRSHAALPYLTEQEWRQHVAMVRDMAQRNHLLIGFRDHVRAFIGPVSVQFVLRGGAPGAAAAGPVDADGDGRTDVNPIVTAVQEAVDECFEANDWGQGETDREEECLGRAILEGEATLEFFRGGRDCVPLMRHVEPELIRTPQTLPDGFPWAREEDWRGGVLTRPNDAERHEAIYIADPEGDGGRVVRADRFVRCKLNVDRVVKRGMSDFLPVAEMLRKVQGLLDNMGHVARLQAAIAWWEQYPTATEQQVRSMIEQNRDYQGVRLTPGQSQGTNARTADVKEYDPGSIIRTEQGRQVQVGPTAQPAGFVAVEQAVMRSVSFRFGLPSSFSGEADSFASSLVSGSPFVRIIEGRQKKAQGFTRGVVERVVLLCEESGRLPAGTWRRVKPVLTSKPVVIADEEKKARTFLGLLDKGCADPYKWMAAQGDEPEQLLANLASFKKKMAEMGPTPGPTDQPPPTSPPPPPAPTGPSATPPASAGGDQSSPNAPTEEDVRRRLAESFTGTDAHGHHWVNGKQVKANPDAPNPQDKPAGTDKPADPGANNTEGPSLETNALAAKLVSASPDLPPELATEYTGHMAEVLHKMPEAARKAALESLAAYGGGSHFYPDTDALGKAYTGGGGKLKKGEKLGGFVDYRPGAFDKCNLHLDGAGAGVPAQEVYAHEVWHLVDLKHGQGGGRLSDDPKWAAAWKAEISNKRPASKRGISAYAATDESEGLAEYGRELHKRGIEHMRANFPKATKFLESKGLLK